MVAVEGIVVPIDPTVTLSEPLVFTSPRTGLSPPNVHTLASVMVVQDISLQVRRTVNKALESLATLLDTFSDFYFLSLDATTAVVLKSLGEICSFGALAWNEFSVGDGVESSPACTTVSAPP
jgi:hypothetical protein